MFRVKIVLLTLALTGSVLVGFGLYALSLMNRAGLERIDRELLALGGGQLHAFVPRGYWRDFDKSLRLIYGEERGRELAVRISIAEHEVLYQSGHWPAELSERLFPAFDPSLEPLPLPFRPQAAQDFNQRRPLPLLSPGLPAFPPNRDPFDRPGIPRGPAFRGERTGPLPSPVPNAELNAAPPPMRIKKPFFLNVQTPNGSWRAAIMGNQYVTILAGMNMARLYEEQERFQRAFLGVVPLALLLLAGGGWVIAHRALKPVSLITSTAESITAHDLGKRIPPTAAGRELARLTLVVNNMLDRLQKGFEQARRFSADAAHELQTPLAVLQGELEYEVQRAAVGSEEQRRAGVLLEEAQRLKTIVQKLLVLARADAGKLDLHAVPVDLSSLIESAAEDAGAMAPELRIEKTISAGITVQADPDLLRQVIQNLVANAVKYNREPGLIRFRLAARDGKAQFSIANSGIRIPNEDRERIFDRFYRVDKARSRSVPGSGLGLSLAREIARAHHGELRLDPDRDGLVSFTLVLPLPGSSLS